MDRDAVLVAALGTAVLAACTSSSPPAPTPSPSTPSPEPVDPDLALLLGWHTAELTMAARYGGGNVPVFGDLHRAHARDVADHLRVRGEPPPPPPSRGPYRGRRPALLKALARAERDLAARYQAALADVRDPKVALLGAELAASARQCAAVLVIA